VPHRDKPELFADRPNSFYGQSRLGCSLRKPGYSSSSRCKPNPDFVETAAGGSCVFPTGDLHVPVTPGLVPSDRCDDVWSARRVLPAEGRIPPSTHCHSVLRVQKAEPVFGRSLANPCVQPIRFLPAFCLADASVGVHGTEFFRFGIHPNEVRVGSGHSDFTKASFPGPCLQRSARFHW